MTDDRSAVERLADTFAEREAAQHEFTDTYGEGQRDAWDHAEADLRSAIEADRAAGCLLPPGAIGDLQASEAELVAAPLQAEVERLERWKADANEVLGAWTSVWVALGQPGQLGDSIAAQSLAEVERLKDETPTVEIEQELDQPTTCTVTYQGRTVFDGVSRDALVERETEVQRLRKSKTALVEKMKSLQDQIARAVMEPGQDRQKAIHAYAERAKRAEAKLARVRALADEDTHDLRSGVPGMVRLTDLREAIEADRAAAPNHVGADRAEAKLAEVRALAKEWQDDFEQSDYSALITKGDVAANLRAVLDQEADDD